MLVAVALWIPYVVVQYRRRGTVGARRAYVHATLALYLIVAWCLVLLPLPDIGGRFCLNHQVQPNLEPFAWVGQMLREWARDGGEPVNLIANKVLWIRLFNIALLVPLGVFARRWFSRGLLATAAMGFALSLAFEVTQLTGLYGLYPCAYRLFDVDDLMANTLGAILGWVIAPLVVLLPRRRGSDDERPRRESPTVPRRAVADLLDLMLAGLVAVGGFTAIALVAGTGLIRLPSAGTRAEELLSWSIVLAALAVVVVLIAWAAGGRTPGKAAVRLAIRRRDGGRPGFWRLAWRALCLWGLLLLPAIALDLMEPSALAGSRAADAAVLALIVAVVVGWPLIWLVVVLVVVVARADDRGPHDLAAGTVVTVTPPAPPESPAAQDAARSPAADPTS